MWGSFSDFSLKESPQTIPGTANPSIHLRYSREKGTLSWILASMWQNILGNGGFPSRSRDGGGKKAPEGNPEELWSCPKSWLWLQGIFGSLIARAKRCNLKFPLDTWIWDDPSWKCPTVHNKPLGWVPFPGSSPFASARTLLTDHKSNPGAFSCRNRLTNKNIP